MLIAEELLLVGLDPAKGSLPMGTSDYVKIGLSGALLAELALMGAIDVRDGKVVAVPGEPPSDPLLAELQTAIAAEPRGIAPKSALKRLDRSLGGVRQRLSDRLVEAGVLAKDEGGLLSSTKYPVADRAAHSAVLRAAQAAATGAEPLTDRQAILLALAGPCRLLERIAPERSDHKQAKARIAAASEQAPFAPEVKKVIDELIAAVAMVAVIATTSAG